MDPDHIPAQFNAARHFIDRHLDEGRGAKAAFECGNARLTYADLLERVNRAGNALRALGIRMEERVALLLLDTFAFPICFFGAIKIGAVAVPINTLLRASELEFILNDTRARVLVVSGALLPKVLEIPRDRLPYLQQIVVDIDPAAGLPAAEAPAAAADDAPAEAPNPLRRSVFPVSLDELLKRVPAKLDAEATSKDDAAFWLYSSGSTGAPKACVHLQHDMVVCAERYGIRTLGIREDDRCFSVAKLFFAYGLGNAGYFHLAVGATSILWPGSPKPLHVYSVIERYRPTLFFSVPSNFAALLAHPGQGWRSTEIRSSGMRGATERDFDLSSVRYAVSAGEALPAAMYERFRQRFGIEILDAIGSTECLHMFIANRPGAVRPGSSGQIIEGFDAKILDESGHPTPAGEIGNLFVRSDATCSHYWNQHERTRDVIEGQWIRTGDKYRVDADGFYWYAGRSDDMLKVNGAWVSPVEIEAALVEHPAVLEAAVVGQPDAQDLVKPRAFVVLRTGSGSPELARELEAFVAARLAPYKRPRWVEFVNTLPKTATGKIQRFRLRSSS